MDKNTIAELEAKAEALEKPFEAALKTLKDDITATLKQVLEDNKADMIAKVGSVNDSYAEIEVHKPGSSRGWTISIYFPRYPGAKRRTVSLNIGTFGSFNCEEQDKVDFYVIAGILSSNLRDIQARFDKIDFAAYDEAHMALFRASEAAQAAQRELQAEERTEKTRGIVEKLIVGTKIQIGKDWNDKPIVHEIIRVTPKLIWLNNMYGTYTKKERAIDALLNKKWAIVD